MFAIVHQMRTRLIISPSFTGERILAAILFENTMDRDIEKQPTADYLWNVKRIVPILKVDKGLEAEKDGVQLMKPFPSWGPCSTKRNRNASLARRCVRSSSRPIPPESRTSCGSSSNGRPDHRRGPRADHRARGRHSLPKKSGGRIAAQGGHPRQAQPIAGRPGRDAQADVADQPDLYADFVKHPKVVRVLALSGGYSRDEANELLRKNHGMVASFSAP